MPITRPPADFAPRAAAAVTPPRPPQTMTAPACASPAPTASASASSRSSVTSPGPTTATCGGRRTAVTVVTDGSLLPEADVDVPLREPEPLVDPDRVGVGV